MDQRLAAAEAALQAGRGGEVASLLLAVLEADADQDASVYRALLHELYQAGRLEEGARWGEIGAGRYPRDIDTLNLLGVILRRLRRLPQALEVLSRAAKLAPHDPRVQSNRGNVLLEMRQGARAEAVLARLVRAEPRNAEYQRQLGHALYLQGKRPAAAARFRQAAALDPANVAAWVDLSGLLVEGHEDAEALALLDRALAVNPGHPRLQEARATALRRAGEFARCEAFLTELMAQTPDAGWLQFQLGGVIGENEGERDRANLHLRRAVALEPGNLNFTVALMESLERTRSGDEGAHLDEAYALARGVLAQSAELANPGHLKVIFETLVRLCAFDEVAALPGFKARGRAWAESGRHAPLLRQLAHVETPEDRQELLEQHRVWGRDVAARAARSPIRKPGRRQAGGTIRLGFLSSDLRDHPVGYFALPLFEHAEPERFELYCYSFFKGGYADPTQTLIAEASAAYRVAPGANARDGAQMIADDQLDMLIELGGSTDMNKVEVLAWRPAPIQASWLGYPHSVGLAAIDYLICDPLTAPTRRDLMIEKPLMMPQSWIALGRMAFSDDQAIEPGLPQDRAGVVTFGTANHPHKYNRTTIALWARVLSATPGSRFMVVRPEAAAGSFRRNLTAEFARHGIATERILFHPIRGAHMAVYNEIDISLDTAPLTGGTTTTESLWMGVPVVSLVGEALFERLSYSILANSGLADLAAADRDEFVRIATALAADRARRLALRHTLREQMRLGPLGRSEQFAKDFYDLIARTVRPKP